MRFLLIAAALFAAAPSGVAQQAVSIALGDRIEAQRPQMKPRKLTAGEAAKVSELIAGFEQDLANQTPSAHWLVELKPLAETGDKTAMKAMMRFNDVYRLDQPEGETLSALWAAEYWKLHGPDREAAKLIAGCAGGSSRDGFYVGKNESWDCGFDTRLAKPTRFGFSGFDDYAEKKGPAPKVAAFIPRSLAVGQAGDRERFESLVSVLKGGGDLDVRERSWAKAYADKMGPSEIAALQAAIDDYPNAVARLTAVNQQIAAERRASQIREWERLDAQPSLSPGSLESFEQLSILLGPEYLARFGAKYVIYGLNHIQAACQAASPQVCGEQLRLHEARKAQAEAEARARNAPIENWGDKLFVDVRIYDQGGNFVGAQTMTRSQADTIGAN